MKIVYKDSEGVKVVHPAPGYDYKIVADKDVPAGLNFVFIAEEDLPPRETRAGWDITITKSNRDGVGLTQEQFNAKYPELDGWAVK
jgi:hypothetical protein